MTNKQFNAFHVPPMRPGSLFWPTLAAIVVIVVTVSLGRWQLDRAQFREQLAAHYNEMAKLPPTAIGSKLIDASQLAYHRVSASGRWLTEYGIFLDNQVYQGQAGFDVYMPLRLEGSDTCLLVNRGWVVAGRDRAHLPEIRTPWGNVEVYGTVQLPARFKELGSAYRQGRIWENITPERFRKWSGLTLQPVFIQQTGDPGDGLIRDWPRPDNGADRNRGYAFQWFAMAVLAFVLWVYHFFRRGTADVE
ncbi:MAG: SURF1 family protein [Sterolibacterium sp.]|nr:SURF1 family protein [Sterolibacterium sp.]